MSLPIMYGFVNDRWLTVVDVMLEKKKNSGKIYQLQITRILEADFNTALEILLAHKLMTNAKTIGIHEEQWGYRQVRTTIDSALCKMMTFEYDVSNT